MHIGRIYLLQQKEVESSGDVNQDGIVNVLDIILVAQNLGQKPPSNPRVDVNKDGQVNVLRSRVCCGTSR